MNWNKLGLVFNTSKSDSWSQSHAQVPFAFPLDEQTIRVFYATRDQDSKSAVCFVDVDAQNPTTIKYQHDKPCFSAGKLGYCDDSGTMPSWFLRDENRILLYYTAWNSSKTASYRLSIGLAESTDNGLTFNRLFEGPVLDRGTFDPIWVGQPCVRKEGNKWKMWYLSCVKIEYINNHPEPFYDVKYATSNDGINWHKTGNVCIALDEFTDAIGRPSVIFEDGIYKMYYSYRSANGYRNDVTKSYRLGYAESIDGIVWTRKDNEMNLKNSSEGWDSEMTTYPNVVQLNDRKLMFYNGNGFGASGFGVAVDFKTK
ncbi:MAG: hypothetical protein KA327_02910 [Pseudarcicella sp.]|nr:hypothetical protein [Pseudarcicella sp.]